MNTATVTDTGNFSALSGRAICRPQDSLMERYANWSESMHTYAHHPVFVRDRSEEERKLKRGFNMALEALRGIIVQQGTLEGFLAGVEELEQSAARREPSGLFINAILARLGSGVYVIRGAERYSWVGHGLDRTILVAEHFGYAVGAYGTKAVFQQDLPKELPQQGIIFVSPMFGDEAGLGCQSVKIYGGTFDEATASRAQKVVIHNGTFNEWAADDAGCVVVYGGIFKPRMGRRSNRVVIYGGTFRHHAGRWARKVIIYNGKFDRRVANGAHDVTIYNGVFGSYASSEAQKLAIHGGVFDKRTGADAVRVLFKGGTYADQPWNVASVKREDIARTVQGTIESYGRGKEKRWRITPNA